MSSSILQSPVRYRLLAVIETTDLHAVERLLREFPAITIGLVRETEMTKDSGLTHLLRDDQREAQERPTLTPRQRQILRLLEQGWSNKEIARSLQLSHFTVRNHIASIFKALGIKNRWELQSTTGLKRAEEQSRAC